MEAIKHSRIIVVLLILYIGISIIVVTMDNSNRKNKKENSNTSEKDTKKYDEFISEIGTISLSVESYYENNEIVGDVCIPLSNILGAEYSGSAYVSENGQSIRMWYSNGTYAINNIETKQDSVESSDIEKQYTTEYYNTCALNE